MSSQTTKSSREARIQEASSALQSGFFDNLTDVARAFDIPRSTLRYRLSAGSKKQQGGQNKKLNGIQEKALCEWLDSSTRDGFPPRRDDIHQMASKLLAEGGASSATIGKCWVARFLKRHPQYQICHSKPQQQPSRGPAKMLFDTAHIQRQAHEIFDMLQQNTSLLTISEQKEISKALLAANKHILDSIVQQSQLDEWVTGSEGDKT